MRPLLRRLCLLALGLSALSILPPRAVAQRQPELLGRAVVALRGVDTGGSGTNNWSGSGLNQVYVGWRLLATDPEGIAFNVYRSANGGAATKLNASPLTTSTNYVDTSATLTVANTYHVTPVINGVEGAVSQSWTLPANSAAQPCLTIPMPAIADGTYYVHLAWAGDLDGDGYPEIVVDRLPSTGTSIKLEAYSTRTRTRLWQIDYGANGAALISSGQNDGVVVFDFDGDGRCEVVTKSVAGTVFGDGSVLAGSGTAVYLSVVDGATGAERSRTQIATAIAASTDAKNMGVAFLDGVRPSLVYMDEAHDYNAYDVAPGTFVLTPRWKFDTPSGSYPHGHGFRVGDLDGDGRDEISDVAMAIDDNGTALFINELNHGDRFHVADIDPDRPGLECFAVQQDNPTQLNYVLYDALSGQMIWRKYASGMVDNGRGNIGSIDARLTGQQSWSAASGTLVDQLGNPVSNTQPSNCNFSIWWDADVLRETLNRQLVDKWNSSATAGGTTRLLTGYNFAGASYSWRDAVPLYGDILGDWREEIVTESGDDANLVVFSTTAFASSRYYTLLQDPRYRADMTLKGYMQSHHPGFYFGQNMPRPPRAPFWDGNLTWVGSASANVWDKSSVRWKTSATGAATSAYSDGQSALFDLSGVASAPVTLAENLAPSRVAVHASTGQTYTFSGAGSLTGSMTLTKGGHGSLVLSGNHTYTGATVVSEGTLLVDGQLSGSAVRVDSRGILGGSGIINQPVSVSEIRSALAPGGVGQAGALQLAGGVTFANQSVVHFDLSSSPAGPKDLVAITGNLSNSGLNAVYLQINLLDGTLTPGATYTLFTYTGSFSGNLTAFTVRGVDAYPCTLANTGSAITLTVGSTRAANTVTWAGGNSSSWLLASSTGTGWLKNSAADVFVSGDAVRFDDTGSANSTVTLSALRYPASTVVDGSANYTFTGAGGIGGSGGLTKSGSGVLTISTNNTYTGPTTITGGVVSVASLADGGRPSPLGASGNASANLVLNGGTLRLTSGSTSTFRGMTLGASGGTVDLPSSSSLLSLSGVIAGSGSFTKTGPGRLLFSGVNTYTGGTVITGGTVVLTASREDYSPTSPIQYGLGSGSVTLSGGATVVLSDTSGGDFDYVDSRCFWPVVVPSGSSGRVDANGRMTFGGALTGAGDFTFFTPYVRTDVTGNWSAFAGKINVVTDGDGGDFRIGNVAGLGNAWLDLAANVYAYSRVSGTNTLAIGALSGAAGSVLNAGTGSGLGQNYPATWQIGARNLDTTFAGVISGTSAVTKIGAGALTLSGANTYTGNTTVTTGRLLLAGGSLAATRVTVSSGAGFGGQGGVAGNVTFNAGSIFVANPAGPLAITGSLAFSGAITVVPVAGAPLSAGTYTLYTCTGVITGTPTFTWNGPGYSATFNTSVAGQVTYTLAPSILPPTNLAALPGDTSASLSWTASASAVASYTVKRATVSGGPYTTVATGLTGTTYTDTGLVNGTTYYYVVTAISANSSTADGAQASVSVGPAAPYINLRLDESSGTVASNSASVGGSWRAGLIGAPAWTAGRINNGLTFASASSQYGTFPSGVVSTLNDFTVSAWVNVSTLATWARVFDFGTGTSNYMFLTTRYSTANLPRFGIRTASVTEQTIDSTIALTAGAWTHVAVTLSGSTGTFYLNGVAVGTNTAMTLKPASLGSTTLNYLGRSQFSSDPYIASALDEFQIYARALTAAEIAALATPPSAPAGLSATAGDAQAVLSWSSVSGVDSYSVKRAPAATGPYSIVASGLTATSYTDTGLANGTTYYYAVTATRSVAESARSASVSATPVQPLTAIQSWRLTYFGTSAATGSSADDADPDSDGSANLLEYALGTDPSVANSAAYQTRVSSGVLQFTFTRVADSTLTYTVQGSFDLSTWTDLWSGTGAQNIAGPVTVSDTEPVSTAVRRFLRLRVSH